MILIIYFSVICFLVGMIIGIILEYFRNKPKSIKFDDMYDPIKKLSISSKRSLLEYLLEASRYEELMEDLQNRSISLKSSNNRINLFSPEDLIELKDLLVRDLKIGATNGKI